mmetsp:Transcript_95247/g.284416  ORF Transcript_95247/g.284416 Transcript_95247/m.284416 type:complete len:353 (-) Transcript_95247:346-1404(-)
MARDRTWQLVCSALACGDLAVRSRGHCHGLCHQNLWVGALRDEALAAEARRLACECIEPPGTLHWRWHGTAVGDSLLGLAEVIQVYPDALVPAAGEDELVLVPLADLDLHVRHGQVPLLAGGVEGLEHLEHVRRGVVAVGPEGLALRLKVLLGAVVDNWHALCQHAPNDEVSGLRPVAVAGRGGTGYVVVVRKVAQAVHALVDPSLHLLRHALAQELQVPLREGEPGAAEGGLRREVRGEVEHPIEDGAAGGWGVCLELCVEGEVRGGHLADDGDPCGLLELGEEVKGHEGRCVEPEGVDLVGLHVPLDPGQLLLTHKGVRLVQVPQVVEPALLRHLLAVALARVVAGLAEV